MIQLENLQQNLSGIGGWRVFQMTMVNERNGCEDHDWLLGSLPTPNGLTLSAQLRVHMSPTSYLWSIFGWSLELQVWKQRRSMTPSLRRLMCETHFFRWIRTIQSWWSCREKTGWSRRILPGQRLGAKQWFQYLRNHLQETMDFEFSMEQPCMARTKECTIIIHVDDILFVGLKTFWKDVFLPNMSQKFSISHDQLQGNGTSIKFLRRTITEVPEGLVLSPGTSVAKVVQSFEQHFGTARAKRFRVIPVCNGWQLTETWWQRC